MPFAAMAQAPSVQALPGLPAAAARAMAFGNGRYLALFEDNKVYTAGADKRWQPLPAAQLPAAALQAVAFANGQFVAVGEEGTVLSSVDGTNWTAVDAGVQADLLQVQYVQGKWFALGGSQTLLTSTDAENWERVDLGQQYPAAVLRQLAYANGQWVLAGQHAMGAGLIVYHSVSGASGQWTCYEPAEATLVGLSALNNEFFLFTNEAAVLRSTDGVAWSDETEAMSVLLPNDSVQTIGGANSTWGGWYQQGRYYLYGYSEFYGKHGAVFSSADGWHFVLEAPTAYLTGRRVQWVHDALVLAGEEGFVYSNDAKSLRYFGGRFADAATNGQHTVTVGSLATCGQIFSSANLYDWTDRTPAGLREMNAVVYHDGKFVAAGNQQVWQSTDNGQTWQSLSEPPYIFFRLQYGKGAYVAAARSTTGADYLLYSTNGIQWQEVAAVTDINFYRLRCVNGQWLAMGMHSQQERGELWTSADGQQWQPLAPVLGQPLYSYYDVMFDGARYHFAVSRTLEVGSSAPGAFCTIVTSSLQQPDSFRMAGAVVPEDEPGLLGAWEGQVAFAWSEGYWVGTAIDLQDADYSSYLLYSRNGIDWHAQPLGNNYTTPSILAFGHEFVTFGASQSITRIQFAGSALPTVLTGQPCMLYSTGATLTQNSVAAGFSVAATGVVVATHAAPTLADMQVPAGTKLQFSATLTGLQNNQLYYARAFAATAAGVAYGNVVSFTTACNALVEGGLAENNDEAELQTIAGQAQLAATGCRAMASIRPWGAAPVSGSVAAKAWVRPEPFSFEQQWLVGRAFQLQPAQQAATATAIVTLYYAQTDFDEFNAANSVGYLPAMPTDAAGKANLRVYKFAGTSADGSGEPASFGVSPALIDPADDSIVWNAGLQRWEISFAVAGFSGFFVGNAGQHLLPISIVNWKGHRQADGSIRLQWQATGSEPAIKWFDVQRSSDGRQYEAVGQVAASGAHSYNWADKNAPAGPVWYRLAWSDGRRTHYSAVLAMGLQAGHAAWTLTPNPATRNLWIQAPAGVPEAGYRVVGANGRIYQTGRWQAGQALELGQLPAGLYRLVLTTATDQKSLPFNKQ